MISNGNGNVNKFSQKTASILRCSFSVSFSGAAALRKILRANKYIILRIHTAEAQVCANWVVLRKSVVLLAPLIIYNKKSFKFSRKISCSDNRFPRDFGGSADFCKILKYKNRMLSKIYQISRK